MYFMKTLEDYFIHRNDETRLQSYYKWTTRNLETFSLLVHEYFLGVEYNDEDSMLMFSRVIDYLLDCYNG